MGKDKSIKSVKSPLNKNEVIEVLPTVETGAKKVETKLISYNFTDTYTWSSYLSKTKEIQDMINSIVSRIARDVMNFYEINYTFDNNGQEQKFIAKKGATEPLQIKPLTAYTDSFKKVITNSLSDKAEFYGIINYNKSFLFVSDLSEDENGYFVTIDKTKYYTIEGNGSYVYSVLGEHERSELEDLYNLRQYARFAVKTMMKLGSKPVAFVDGLSELMSSYGSDKSARKMAIEDIKKQIKSVLNSQTGYLDSKTEIRLLEVIKTEFLSAVNKYITQQLCLLFGFSNSYFSGEVQTGMNSNTAGISDEKKNNAVLKAIGLDILEGVFNDLKINYNKKAMIDYDDLVKVSNFMRNCQGVDVMLANDMVAMKNVLLGELIDAGSKK